MSAIIVVYHSYFTKYLTLNVSKNSDQNSFIKWWYICLLSFLLLLKANLMYFDAMKNKTEDPSVQAAV